MKTLIGQSLVYPDNLTVWLVRSADAHIDNLGFIPSFLHADDPDDVKKQFNKRYIAGWSKFEGHKMLKGGSLKYPEDPPLPVLFEGKFRDETILVYQYGWVAVVEPDGSFEVCRMD